MFLHSDTFLHQKLEVCMDQNGEFWTLYSRPVKIILQKEQILSSFPVFIVNYDQGYVFKVIFIFDSAVVQWPASRRLKSKVAGLISLSPMNFFAWQPTAGLEPLPVVLLIRREENNDEIT